jgi:hypothetical protein
MRISTAYFAGVGTVIMAVGAGLGGGYLAANVTHPPTQAVSKLERRMSAEPVAVSTAPAVPVPQVAAATTNPAAAPAQEPTPQQPQTQQQPNTQQQPQQPQIEAAASSANPARAEEKPANNVAAAQPVQPPPQPSKSADQADEKTAGPREVYARASDADVKRADAEKRRAERRQQWTDKRRWKQPREQDLSKQPREPELDAVEARVREVTEPRRIRIREEGEQRDLFAEPRRREMFAEPVRSETPRIRLFDQD